MADTIEQQLNTYIHQLNATQKKSLLGFIKSILPGKEKGESEVYTIEQYNKELEEAEAEIKRGEFYTHEEAKEIFKKHISDRK